MGSKIYDDWERLVDAVLRREQLRELAMCSSKETSSIDDESSCFSNGVNESFLHDWSDIASSSSTIDGSFRFSFSSTSLFSEHSVDDDTALPTDPDISYEALPKFEEVSDSEKPELFIKKMNMCCVTFDFTDPTKNLKEKEIKRQTLLELFNYVISADRKFTETVMEAFVEMVSVNIFRDFTPQPRGSKPVDAVSLEEDDPINPSRTHWRLIVNHALREEELVAFDHAWLHLQTVYEFFLRFVVSEQTDAKVAKGYIDLPFIQKLINLFDSEDPRERIYLKNILENIYRKFIMHRRSIRRAINNVFYHFIYETKTHNGIAELLKILGNIIPGFILPLKEEHEISLTRALIPLHKSKCLAKYHEQLSHCIVEFVKKEPKLACAVIKGLIRYWPVTNSLKEVLFLDELEDVLEVTQQAEFQQCIVPLFNQVSRSLSSSHSRVAERAAMFCQDNEYIVTLIKQNCEVILPIIFPALDRSARDHWNRECRVLTLKVRDYFYDLNPDQFQDDESKEHENNVKSETSSSESSSDESYYGVGPAIPPQRDTNMFHKLKEMSTHTYLDFEFNHVEEDYEVLDVHDLRKTNLELPTLNESFERKLAEREHKIENLQKTIKEMRTLNESVERKLAEREHKIENLQEMYEWNKMLVKEEEAKRESSNKVIMEELRRSRMKLRVMYILFMVLLYFLLFRSRSIIVSLTFTKFCKVRYQGDILTLDG